MMNQATYLHVKVVSPLCLPAQIEHNTECIRQEIRLATQNGVDLLVFPELCLTGATCGDLFAQPLLQKKATEALYDLAQLTTGHPFLTVILGTIMEHEHKLFNGAAVLQNGKIQAFIPKVSLSAMDRRYFQTEFYDLQVTKQILDQEFSFGHKTLVLPLPWHLEEGEKPISPNTVAKSLPYQLLVDFAHDGKTLLRERPFADVHVHLSATPSLAGSREKIREMLALESRTWSNVHIFAQVNAGESSTDNVFAGERFIFVQGQEVWHQSSLEGGSETLAQSVICDLGNSLVAQQETQFLPKQYLTPHYLDEVKIDLTDTKLHEKTRTMRGLRPIEHAYPHHFSAQDFLWETAGLQAQAEAHYQEVFRLQVMALRRRVQYLNVNKLVLGISGGLDSTLALLVACACFDDLGLDRKGLICLTLPGFGTTDLTYQNACNLVRSLGCTLREISIVPAVKQHFSDIDHPLDQHDLTYENAQARERTQILMDVAGRENTFVVGTGDASELALGWCTYNGDHMSMYGVNASIPKTLIPLLLYAQCDAFAEVEDTLLSIIHTPISPELLPLNEKGELQQKTEDSTGPYVLHDFFLYHHLVNKISPKEFYRRACLCFDTGTRNALDAYKPGFYIVHPQRETFAESDANLLLEAYPQFSRQEILHWLKKFYWRFFTQQFKRSCSPDGAQVTPLSFSPRSGLNLSSDILPQLWLSELEEMSE